MKKSVLSIVAIAFAAVSVLSSCDKNDDGYGQSAKPHSTVINTQTTVLPGQQNLANKNDYRIVFKYVGTEDGKQVTTDYTNISFTDTEDNAINTFQSMYAKKLNDLQKFLNEKVQNNHATNAKIICTLTDSKGDVLQEFDL